MSSTNHSDILQSRHTTYDNSRRPTNLLSFMNGKREFGGSSAESVQCLFWHSQRTLMFLKADQRICNSFLERELMMELRDTGGLRTRRLLPSFLVRAIYRAREVLSRLGSHEASVVQNGRCYCSGKARAGEKGGRICVSRQDHNTTGLYSNSRKI